MTRVIVRLDLSPSLLRPVGYALPFLPNAPPAFVERAEDQRVHFLLFFCLLRGKSDFHEAMVAWCAVTFQLQEALQVDCRFSPIPGLDIKTHPCNRFAFVEYESRRDADDAYHEMHNKRIGRDDLLKIEVWATRLNCTDPADLHHWRIRFLD